MANSKIVKPLTYAVFSVITTLTLLMNFDYYSGTILHSSILSALNPDLKYILVWTNPTRDPIMLLGVGVKTFIKKHCPVKNCYVSSNKRLFQDLSGYDAVLFHGPDLNNNPSFLPKSRSPQQKYIFASMESSDYYRVCNRMYNGYFNWTWTYKLDSDEYYGYIVIKNKSGHIIGPREKMHWENVKDMKPINDSLKQKLSNKKFAAAWFVSNCRTQSGRESAAKMLKIELSKYNMTLDIYGACGTKTCPRDDMAECLRKVERDYYFYLSFENSISEDYVTEKLLHALKHYAVPVVYGGANYTRFMPDGIYLNVRTQSIRELAEQMVNIIHDKQKYYNFFKWHNSYSYHDVDEFPDTNSYCKLCALVNNKQLFEKTSVYNKFTKWWNSRHSCF